MARYNAQLIGAAAVAADTAFGWFGYNASSVARLRRVTLGVAVTSGSITSQQCVVGINITTGAATINTSATSNKLDSGSAAPNQTLITAMTTPPTLGATGADAFKVAFNTQSGVDLPWELLEEWRIGGSTSAGVAFVNRVTALPANHEYILSVEWEE
jgi:hypothetical protein